MSGLRPPLHARGPRRPGRWSVVQRAPIGALAPTSSSRGPRSGRHDAARLRGRLDATSTHLRGETVEVSACPMLRSTDLAGTWRILCASLRCCEGARLAQFSTASSTSPRPAVPLCAASPSSRTARWIGSPIPRERVEMADSSRRGCRRSRAWKSPFALEPPAASIRRIDDPSHQRPSDQPVALEPSSFQPLGSSLRRLLSVEPASPTRSRRALRDTGRRR